MVKQDAASSEPPVTLRVDNTNPYVKQVEEVSASVLSGQISCLLATGEDGLANVRVVEQALLQNPT